MRTNADRHGQAVFFGLRQQVNFAGAADMKKVRGLSVLPYKSENVANGLFLGMDGDQLVGGPGAIVTLTIRLPVYEQIPGGGIVVDL